MAKENEAGEALVSFQASVICHFQILFATQWGSTTQSIHDTVLVQDSVRGAGVWSKTQSGLRLCLIQTQSGENSCF